MTDKTAGTEYLKAAVVKEFDDLLSKAGFRRLRGGRDEDGFVVNYQSRPRYVSLRANTHPRDYPPSFNIILGEGSLDWPECDWNAVALWRMRNFLEKTDSATEFDIAVVPDAAAFAGNARRQLEEFHGGFLDGDLTIFRKVRANQNREREPYKIFEPVRDGKYVERADSESERLRDKFSRE